jgi:hypothetical protein
VAVWDELKAVLARLRDQQPGALTQYPVPGAQQLPLVIFRVPPGQTGQVPLLIGTASFMPRLGYTIPPGDWGIQATLTLGPHSRDSPRRRTPILPLTVTA